MTRKLDGRWVHAGKPDGQWSGPPLRRSTSSDGRYMHVHWPDSQCTTWDRHRGEATETTSARQFRLSTDNLFESDERVLTSASNIPWMVFKVMWDAAEDIPERQP